MAALLTHSVPIVDGLVPEEPSYAEWPKITLLTPALNSARYIEDTIRSVIYQGYPNLEYIIVDGGSTDGTVEIIRKYEKHLSWWVSEPDKGMYDALNKGYARSSGEIMGWISATDMLHQGSLKVVGGVLRAFPQIEWITGLPTGLNEQGMTVRVGQLKRFSQKRFLSGANRYIQQESTFWRRSLWDRAGGYVDASRKIASDFELWVRFFHHARLYPVNALIGGYRSHGDSLGLQDLERCHRIHEEIINAELESLRWGRVLKVIRRLCITMQEAPTLGKLWWPLVMRHLYFRAGPDSPPVIESWKDKWVMQR